MANYFFVMGFPYSGEKDERNAKQERLFAALKGNANKAPISMVVYLIRDSLDRLWTVCEWPDTMGDLGNELWGGSSIFRKWVMESNGPRYEDADILGPRTHGVEGVNSPSTIVDSFSTSPTVGLPEEAGPAAQRAGGVSGESGSMAGEPMFCQTCGKGNPKNARFCAHCGEAISVERDCPTCGRPYSPEESFCPACGTRLTAVSPQPPDAQAGQQTMPTVQPTVARRATRPSSLAEALPSIQRESLRSTETDRQMSFWGNLFATFALSALTLYVGGLIWSWIFHYRLVERQNQHFARQRRFYGRVVKALRQHGQEVNNDELVATATRAKTLLDEAVVAEPRRSPWLWGVILPPLTFGIAMFYTYWFLMNDLQKHSVRQMQLTETIREGLQLATGRPISIDDESAVPQRNFWLYLLLTPLLGISIFLLIYRIFDDPNKHFARQELVEQDILSSLSTASVVTQ